jgi:hypothetical protein
MIYCTDSVQNFLTLHYSIHFKFTLIYIISDKEKSVCVCVCVILII